MNHVLLALLIAVGICLLVPGLAPAAVRFPLLALSTFCVLGHVATEFWSWK